jgi:hypothetical protein
LRAIQKMLKSDGSTEQGFTVLARKSDDCAAVAEESLVVDLKESVHQPALPRGEVERFTGLEAA